MLDLKGLASVFKVRHEEAYSRGAKLQVVENDSVRMFKLDGATNSIIRKGSIYTGGYWDYFVPLAYAYANPRILLIGLGLGTTPFQLHALLGKSVRIDIVEVDEEVVKLARKYAPWTAGDRIYVQDGRNFVSDTRKKYDILMLDAYWKGARIPNHFLTEEFMRDAYDALAPDGVLAINYAMHPSGILGFGAFRKLLDRFRCVWSISTDTYGSMRIIVCSKTLDKKKLLAKISRRFNGKPSLMKSYRDMREI